MPSHYNNQAVVQSQLDQLSQALGRPLTVQELQQVSKPSGSQVTVEELAWANQNLLPPTAQQQQQQQTTNKPFVSNAERAWAADNMIPPSAVIQQPGIQGMANGIPVGSDSSAFASDSPYTVRDRANVAGTFAPVPEPVNRATSSVWDRFAQAMQKQNSIQTPQRGGSNFIRER